MTTKGSVGRTTPAVAASDRRKSLKLVGRQRRGEKTDCLQLNCKKKKKEKVPRVLRCHFSLQDCLLGSARCILFQCPLHSFSGQAVLNIQARLWNSSFIEVKNKTKQKQIPCHQIIPYSSLHLQLMSTHMNMMERNNNRMNL